EMPRILAALGERLPNDEDLEPLPPQLPLEELILELSDPKILIIDTGARRVNATAELIYKPADDARPEVKSKRFNFTAPIGLLETDEIKWYLEDYYLWPTELYQERARTIEGRLPEWGEELYKSIRQSESARNTLSAWEQSEEKSRRRFSILIDSDPPENSSEEKQQDYYAAASGLFSIPWEIMHDGSNFVCRNSSRPAQVRRRLPNREHQPTRLSKLPIRILLVSPRPEQKGVSYLDHRMSAKPLLQATAQLGSSVEIKILETPTYPALAAEIQSALDKDKPYDVLHFDGHGIFDRQRGLGALCFESASPNEQSKLHERAMELIHADKMAELLDKSRIPLVF
ncbi:MAG: CHAT domain-containing protein, partial [Bacteroidota bacterium]